MNEPSQKLSRQRLVISGDVEAPSFVAWIERHGTKLGLTDVVCHKLASRVEVEASGLEEMLDAMEVACLLGPAEVWVDSVSRTRLINEWAYERNLLTEKAIFLGSPVLTRQHFHTTLGACFQTRLVSGHPLLCRLTYFRQR